MEQAGSCGLRDSSRSNDLLALLSNFITHGDFSTGSAIDSLTASSPGVVVAADIEDSIVEPLSQNQLEVDCFNEHNHLQSDSQCMHENCSCLEEEEEEEESIEATEEVADAEAIEQFQSYSCEVEAASTNTTAVEGTKDSTESGENYLSHNNICKTINDITNSQKTLNSEISIPQNPVLEAAISMSNIPPSSVPGANEFFSMPDLAGLEQSQNAFPAQTWTVRNVADGINESVTCQTSEYTNSRQNYSSDNVNSTFIPPYSGSTVGDGYLHNTLPSNEYQNQSFMQANEGTHTGNQMNHQFYQSSQASLQDYQTQLNQHSLPVSGDQDMGSISSAYNKALVYNKNSHCGSNEVTMSHLTHNRSSYNGLGSSTSEDVFHKVNNQLHSKAISESGGEDNILEDRSGEKKLTTTPIPSDAEKMSSSSSISSGSHEESPSPRRLETEHNNASSLSVDSLLAQAMSKNYENFDNIPSVDLPIQHSDQFLKKSPRTNKLNTSNNLVNEVSQSAIPLPENVVEIDQSSMEYDAVNITPGSDGIPVSPSSSQGTDPTSFTAVCVSSNSTAASSSKSTDPISTINDGQNLVTKSNKVADTSSSWSVMKEERRKKRLEKKKRAKLQSKENNSSAVDSLRAHDNQDPDVPRSSRKHSSHRHKHKHRSKRHNQEENNNLLKKDSFQNRVPSVGITISEHKSHKNNSHSGLIPKATADPTTNTHLSCSSKFPGSITAKVKQQLQKNSSMKLPSPNFKPDNAKELPKNSQQNQTSKSVVSQRKDPKEPLQSAREMTIAPAKLGSFPRDNQANNVGIRRWQTVTAIQGPKLPPMLSERDRIPKRGRPSKKMTELNLKYKAEAKAKSAVEEKSVSQPESSSIVATYTINDGGFIQELENKPKQNQRSKERAEAFRKFLSDISKKSSIQKKTAGAKDVVGAFKANGVRTRKQASGQNVVEVDEKRKKSKAKNKVFGGEAASGKPSNKNEILVEHGVYTFSELAKQYKISNSILHRALEQSQRSSLSKRSSKVQKNKESHRPDVSLPRSNSAKNISPEKTTSVLQGSGENVSFEVDDLNQTHHKRQKSVEKSTSPLSIKPISLSSEKSVDTTDVIKKKKKKKHKKDKNGNIKKKKNKDKKKKLKRKDKHNKQELSDSVFSSETSRDLVTANTIDSNPKKMLAQTDVTLVKSKTTNKEPKSSSHTKHSKHKTVAKSTSNDASQSGDLNRDPLSPTCSISSLSGCDEAYDGGDSSSDVEIISPNSDFQSKTVPPATPSSVASASTTTTSAVFGSGIISAMPSFQGIKEHGGLVQFSEPIETTTESNLQKGRKHKHKKKKLVGRAKNAADPEFLGKMEELVKHLEKMGLSPNIGFVPSAFSGKSSNVFATSFQSSRISFTSGGNNAFSYRDPARNHSFKQKRQSSHNFTTSSQNNSNSNTVDPTTSAAHSNMSAFCKADFFTNYGFVKPFTASAEATSFKTLPTKVSRQSTKESNSFIKDLSNKSSLFAKDSGFAAFSVPKTNNISLSHNAKTSEEHESASEIETVNSSQKLAKRKRGWPRGKPRGPRSKRFLSDKNEDFKSSKNDETLNEKRKSVGENQDCSESTNARSTSKTRGSESIKSISTASTSFKNNNLGDAGNVSSLKATKKVSNSESSKHKSLQQENKVNKSDSGDSSLDAPVNRELVNCIKAAITETLTSSYVCSDTVARTVDSAVATYLQSLNADTSSLLPKQKLPSDGQISTLRGVKPSMPLKKGRGRPPKNVTVLSHTSVNANEIKSSDKHPKKVWASLHKGSSSASKKQPGRPKKRGPGRPRKYALDYSDSPQNEKTSEYPTYDPDTTSQFLAPFSCRRASASYAPSSRTLQKSVNNTSLQERPPKKGTRGRKPGPLKKLHVSNTHSIDNNSSIRKPKPSSEASKIRKKFPSSAGSSKISDLIDADDHSLETDDYVMDVSGNNALPADTEEFEMFCAEYSSKSCVKKSIESVVAKLKSKQSGAASNNNFNENNNVDCEVTEFLDPMADFAEDTSPIIDALKTSESNDSGLSLKRKYPTCGYFATSKGADQPPAKRRINGVRNLETTSSSLHEKNYLRAGLFSSAFKAGSDDDYDADEDTSSNADVLFPPTPPADTFLLDNHKDFQLPYDIWWLYNKRSIIPTQDVATHFVPTDKNTYVDTHSSVEHEKHTCSCSVSQTSRDAACGSQCLNRLMYTECEPDTCPCGDKCSNQAIQKKQRLEDLERFQTGDRGWGIKTNSSIPKGKFITEYVGEVVSDGEFKRRMLEVYSNYHNHYCLQLESGVVVDAYRVGNEARYVNHSCRPNCEMQRWLSGRKYRLCLFAKQTITSGGELTFDYSSHAFNLDRVQTCRCGSSNCRGVIGGKSHRALSESSLNRMSKALDNSSPNKRKTPTNREESGRLLYTTIDESHIQPTSAEEMRFIKLHRPFLFRNLARIKKQHERAKLLDEGNSDRIYQIKNKSGNDSETQKSIKLYDVIKDIFTVVITCKDDSGVSISIPFFNLRSKQPMSDHYDHSKDPVDLSFVQDKIETKQYESLEEFSLDLLHAFRNAEKLFGRKSSYAKDVARLRRVFTSARNSAAIRLGENNGKSKDKEMTEKQLELDDRRRNGDYIRCICGLYRDEGVMIQCEKCYVWQHCDCMRVSPDDYGDEAAYFCEECDGREVPKEVEVVPQPPSAPPGHTFYLTLLKDNLLVKQGDCVRLIHDHCLRHRSSNNPPVRTSYRLQSHSTPDSMDFFRIKKLWTDDNGDKFAYGHHFIRPQDTKHMESRLFFTNELLATPFYEIVPLEAVVSLCCVMDLETFRKGKPKDYKEGDIYICQHRVDPSLRIINNVIRNRYPICTKPHVFTSYPVKIITIRNYQVPEHYRKTQSRRTQWLRFIDSRSKSGEDESSESDDSEAQLPCGDDDTAEVVTMDTDELLLPGNERNVKQRRLNGILSKLLKDANTRGRKTSQ